MHQPARQPKVSKPAAMSHGLSRALAPLADFLVGPDYFGEPALCSLTRLDLRSGLCVQGCCSGEQCSLPSLIACAVRRRQGAGLATGRRQVGAARLSALCAHACEPAVGWAGLCWLPCNAALIICCALLQTCLACPWGSGSCAAGNLTA